MAWPMIFKIKDTATGKYVSQLSELGLSLVATVPVGYQDAEFNNANNYGDQGAEGFGATTLYQKTQGPPTHLR